MPIYAYRCTTCGHEKEVLRRVSDPLLTVCPVCHAETFRKQVTAAGFHLKGSGWYATDFRGGTKPAGDSAEAKPADKGEAAPSGGDKPAGGDKGAGDKGSGGDKAAAAPAAAAPAPPSPPAASGG